MHDCEFCGNEIDHHEIIDCITCALDARDPYTAGHSERVSDMALKVWFDTRQTVSNNAQPHELVQLLRLL